MIKIEDIVTDKNLELAFQRLKASPKHIHKTLSWESLKDFELFRNEYYEIIRESILLNKCVTDASVIKAYIPKRGGFVRPITYGGFEITLIYQSIANKLAEAFYPDLCQYYDKLTFGNHINNDFKSPFMFLSWKKRWHKYQSISKNIIEKIGFQYVVDFDIASFYDSIDHQYLVDCLNNKIENNVSKLLISILKQNKSDFSHINSELTSGIPQGPIASIILSEIFLNKYIDEYFSKQIMHNEISYVRYADDIRIFASSESLAKKFITILDLLCRNCGLIPQTSKVGVNFHESSSKFIDQDIQKFSQINNNFKLKGSLNYNTDKKAKELILRMIKTGEIDKTKLNFYIYKISKDYEIVDAILSIIEDSYEYCEPFIKYIYKHYNDNEEVISRLIKIFFYSSKIFLDYPFYIFLNTFKEKIPFSSEMFYKIYKRNELGKWLSKFALISWAECHGKTDILLSLNETEIDNPILLREILEKKHRSVNDQEVKAQFELQLLKSDNKDLILKGISLLYKRRLYNSKAYNNLDLTNPYFDRVIKNKKNSEISYILKKHIRTTIDFSKLFQYSTFSEENEFDQIIFLLNGILVHLKDNNYKLFFDALDQFNNILVERLFIIHTGSRPQTKYGSLLKNNSFIQNDMISVNDIFLKIHEIRNGELHPKNLKTGKFHSSKIYYENRINIIKDIFNKWLKAIEEITAWYNKIY